MKVLLIDDQRLIVLPLERHLTQLGYEVKSIVSPLVAVETYETFLPDLVIVDLNMPTINGVQIINYIRKQKGDQIPVLVLSGTTDKDLLVEAFDLGITDYLRKPLYLEEVSTKVKNCIGVPDKKGKYIKPSITIIERKSVGVIIPCHNNLAYLESLKVTNFLEEHSGYHFCFVNYNSSDKTLIKLQELRQANEENITIYNFHKNIGKAEAIRKGLLYMAELEDLDYLGYLDPELPLNLDDISKMVDTILITDSKMVYATASIPHYSIYNRIAKTILGINPGNKMYNAKLMNKEIIRSLFSTKFISKDLFTVELLMRMKKHFSISRAVLQPVPFSQLHVAASRSEKLINTGEFFKIFWNYRRKDHQVAKNITMAEIH